MIDVFGYDTAPTGSAQPGTANLNVESAGQTIGNLAIVPVGTGGKVTMLTNAGTHLVVDLSGWYTI